MNITTILFGTHTVDLTSHQHKKGLNNIVNSIITELKTLSNVDRVTEEERTVLHQEIRTQLLS